MDLNRDSKPDATGFFARAWRATRWAWHGIGASWRTQWAFRAEAAATLALLPVALWLGRDWFERALLIACCLLVMALELLNSSVETTVDRIGQQRHPLSGRAKDQGAGAVLIALLIAALVWGALLIERFTA